MPFFALKKEARQPRRFTDKAARSACRRHSPRPARPACRRRPRQWGRKILSAGTLCMDTGMRSMEARVIRSAPTWPYTVHAVVGAPVGHDGVHVLEGAFAGETGHEPGGGPGGVGALVQDVVYLIGQGGGAALGNLQNRTHAVHDVQPAAWSQGISAWRLEVAGEAAAAEVLIVGPAPVGGRPGRPSCLLPSSPRRASCSASPLSFFAAPVPSSAAAPELIRWMKPSCGSAVGLPAGDALHGLGAPIGAHVVEAGSGVGDAACPASWKRRSGVSFSVAKGVGALMPFQSKVEAMMASVKSAVGQPVGPLTLPLEARRTWRCLPSASSCQPISSSLGLP